jgi:serine/threonine-protein kinase
MEVQWTPPRAKADPNIRIAYMSDVRMADDTGRVFGKRFELLAPIGAGATAAVYRALDRETKSHVAVKVLHKSLRDDTEAVRYFGQEGRLAARIVHPHLLRAHYYGQQRNGTPFIVFELVPGERLTQVAAMRPMPWRRLGTIVLQVLDALAKLHEESVLHGDIQPDNVIVQQTTLGHDFAKVIDLGFASARGCSRLTLAPEPPSEIHGTPSFIAPERLAGLEPDARADLYSVGALMYFLLTTRQVPDISLAPDELGIPAPSIMAPGARIPPAIDAIVMRALSDVDDRFPTAAAMAGALRDTLAQPDHAPAVAISPATPMPAEDPTPAVNEARSATPIATPEPDTAHDPSPATPASVPLVQEDAGGAGERELPDPPAGPVWSDPRRIPSRAQVIAGMCTGFVLCLTALGVLWRVSTAQDGFSVAEQAMNTAPPDDINTATIHRPPPTARSSSLPLPPPPEPDYTPVTSPKTIKKKGDSRASRMRSQILRCKPLLPFSKSTVTVDADRDGQTRILFSGHKARGEFGDCIGRVAARTKLARDERLAFKM